MGDKDGEGPKNIDYVVRMEKYLAKYDNKKGLHECTDNNDKNKGKCIFDKSVLGACGTKNFGYMPEGGVIKPCILLKLNKIYGFDPVPVEANNITDYKLMSSGLQDIIKSGEILNPSFSIASVGLLLTRKLYRWNTSPQIRLF